MSSYPETRLYSMRPISVEKKHCSGVKTTFSFEKDVKCAYREVGICEGDFQLSLMNNYSGLGCKQAKSSA